MTAKEYLEQIYTLEVKIRQKKSEYNDLRLMAIGSGGQDGARVQTSPKGDAMENKVIKYVEMGKEIEKDIEQLINTRHLIIEQIHHLNDARYVEILFKRYVECKKFSQISEEMTYDKDYTKKLCYDATNSFGSIFGFN